MFVFYSDLYSLASRWLQIGQRVHSNISGHKAGHTEGTGSTGRLLSMDISTGHLYYIHHHATIVFLSRAYCIACCSCLSGNIVFLSQVLDVMGICIEMSSLL